MIIATCIMLGGLAAVAVLSHRSGYRLGGVMVVPLLAVYTFREPLSPVVFAAGVGAAWGAIWAVREFTLNHGRRVFLVGIVTGGAATVLAVHLLATYTPAHLPFTDVEIVASIFPGVAAYNLMRLDADNRLADVLAMVALFVGLVLLGAGALFVFEGRSFPTPPILALPTSDLITWLGIEPRGEPITQIVPEWLSIVVLVTDVVIYEGVRKRYDLRLAGIIIIPLLAVFSVRLASVAVVFAVGATAVFALLLVVHWVSLLYGRVLLALSLSLGTLYALAVSLWVESSIPGLTLFFLGLFVGIAAYNLSRVAPRTRAASLRISAGLFVVFYAVLIAFVEVPPSGLFHETGVGYALVGVVAVGLAGREVYRLERSRPSRDAFARESVFAKADVDGGSSDSPLVDAESASTTGDGLTFDVSAVETAEVDGGYADGGDAGSDAHRAESPGGED
ncbi:capsular biosynthesis protein [Halorubrum persicum]|uniref:Capsular biosynthesis protein n=1 Tax=Halorubrum persicum TaxID=1383844 RepID=A0A2G1WHW4_9EURY|nr:poly-gamma-glutamate biosynthesis protein PgsC/CapC [Halorubrum persicum]PHQ38573.1 capsular biosynthesis protein [Halorubrum persicum]